jgi:hypothetical protein
MLRYFVKCDFRASRIVLGGFLDGQCEANHGFLKRIDWTSSHRF